MKGTASVADNFRIGVLAHIARLPSFSTPWTAWRPKIEGLLTSTPSGDGVFELGDHLSEIFESYVTLNEASDFSVSQSANSVGGTAWECLVCWYLNLALWGTDVVVVKPIQKFLPEVISDALTVSIQNVSTNTESDLVAFTIPNGTQAGSLALAEINGLIRTHCAEISVCVVQCKTNWNDNAQIPMLWDLIYNSSGAFRVPGVTVGQNGVSPSQFRRFTYAFVTVPTSRGPYTESKLPVLRVRGLTGGNYWGRPTVTGVARSIKEFLTTNFAPSFSGTVQNHVARTLSSEPSVLGRFLELGFGS